MEIFKLVGSIMVDTADAEKSLSKTGKEAEGLGDKLSNGLKTAGKWAAGIVAGATAVGTAMVAAAKDTAADLDVIDKASIRMGISAESYQELAYAAGLCGVEMSTMEKAAKKLEGTDLNLDDALDQIMAIGDESERTQAAIDKFGENIAYQLTPLLQSGADGMAAMKQEANDLGLVMSQETVSNGAAMNDMFSKVEQSVATLKNGLMSEFMPYVMSILEFLIENIPMIKETVSNVLNAIMPIVEPIMNAVMALFKSVFALINGDAEGFTENFKTLFQNLVTAFLNIGKSIMQALWTGLKSIWESISNWFSEKLGWLNNSLSGIGGGGMGGGVAFAHAGGLPYVPYDNYPALLHRGETVMNANDSSGLIDAIKNLAANGSNSPINITVKSVLDGKVIGESVTKYQRGVARAYG